MSTKALHHVVDSWLDEVCRHVAASLVFLDDGAAEALHWHGGLSRLLDSGAIGVKKFSIFEKLNADCKKVAFIISSPLTQDVLRTIKATIKNTHLSSCIFITSLPSTCHEIGATPFSSLESEALKWIRNQDCFVEVLHIPVFTACLLDEVFITPPLTSKFPPINSSYELEDLIKDGGLKAIPEDMQSSVKVLANYLDAILEKLQVKCDVFSLGHLSRIVGTELEHLCNAAKKKAHTAKASVLLIDRTLDLAGCLSQVAETPYGKMLRTLPHLPDHTCDVSICMADVAKCENDVVFGFPLLAPGCIAHKRSTEEVDVLKTLMTSKVKEAVMQVNRKVGQVITAEGSDSTIGNALKLLKKNILSYRDKPQLLSKHCGLLQQALGLVQTLEHPSASQLDNLLATEKLLVQNFAISKEGVAKDVGNLIASRKERNYRMSDILLFIAFLYTLSNGDMFDPESESSIQASVMEALLQGDSDSEVVVKALAGDYPDDQEILSAVKVFFKVLKDLSKTRNGFKKYGSLFSLGNPAMPVIYQPLIKQITDDIFNSSEMTDIEFHSGGLRDYIKTGFSLFMNVAKPHPWDNPVVIIFVLGGITPAEIKLVHDVAANKKSTKLLVGSTAVLTPEDVMADLFHVVNEISTLDNKSGNF